MAELTGNTLKSTLQGLNESVDANTQVAVEHRDKVTVGDVTVLKPEDKKPGFFASSVSEVARYLWNDVVKPGVKNLLFDMIVNGSSNMLFDDYRTPAPRQGQRFNRIGYNNMYIDESRLIGPGERRSRGTSLVSQANSEAMGDYIWFQFKQDAQKCIEDANDIIDQYDWVSVLEVYELAGMTCDYTLSDYGWRTFNVADPKPYTKPDGRRGWIIRLPKAHKRV